MYDVFCVATPRSYWKVNYSRKVQNFCTKFAPTTAEAAGNSFSILHDVVTKTSLLKVPCLIFYLAEGIKETIRCLLTNDVRRFVIGSTGPFLVHVELKCKMNCQILKFLYSDNSVSTVFAIKGLFTPELQKSFPFI
jgi:hypothetical protein